MFVGWRRLDLVSAASVRVAFEVVDRFGFRNSSFGHTSYLAEATMDFSAYTPETLLEYLETTGENRRWEFKGRRALSENFQQVIAPEVSAFANSGGGNIVLGISEISKDEKVEGQSKKRRVYSYSIDGWDDSKGHQKMMDYLNGVVSTCVNPHLQEFSVHRIAPETSTKEPIFVIDIGNSVFAPHQTNVNDQFRYYYRTGDKSKEAPHFYLEALRNRITKIFVDHRKYHSSGHQA